jgi:hypothetical protein
LKRSRNFGLLLLSCCASAALLRSSSAPTLFWVLEPTLGCRAGADGIEVVVNFGEEAPVDLASFRVQLNRADVTDQLVRASNGATGRLFGVLDGVNTLHIELRSAAESADEASEGWLEERDIECLVRVPQDLGRA